MLRLLARKTLWSGVLLAAMAAGIWSLTRYGDHSSEHQSPPSAASAQGGPAGPHTPENRRVPIPRGTFRMGNDLSPWSDERPAHDVTVGPFLMDAHEVTNRQFARFVEQTGYVTTAQKHGWSYVYDRQTDQWVKTTGADWRHPGGSETSLVAREDFPVVHVSWYDAAAYARWAGGSLPTEAQWEYAARGGLRDADYPWGNEERPGGRYQANYRQFGPDRGADGFAALAPVGRFPAHGFGLYDMSGNVWEWCADWYAEDAYAASSSENPAGPTQGRLRVVRGGSWLSPEGYRPGHRVWSRGAREPDYTSEDVGFRCVWARVGSVGPLAGRQPAAEAKRY